MPWLACLLAEFTVSHPVHLILCALSSNGKNEGVERRGPRREIEREREREGGRAREREREKERDNIERARERKRERTREKERAH